MQPQPQPREAHLLAKPPSVRALPSTRRPPVVPDDQAPRTAAQQQRALLRAGFFCEEDCDARTELQYVNDACCAAGDACCVPYLNGYEVPQRNVATVLAQYRNRPAKNWPEVRERAQVSAFQQLFEDTYLEVSGVLRRMVSRPDQDMFVAAYASPIGGMCDVPTDYIDTSVKGYAYGVQVARLTGETAFSALCNTVLGETSSGYANALVRQSINAEYGVATDPPPLPAGVEATPLPRNVAVPPNSASQEEPLLRDAERAWQLGEGSVEDDLRASEELL